jgi:hypothetical protein
MPLSIILPTRRSSGQMLLLQLLVNKCRLIHCHHCRCCVRCRRCQNHHCWLNWSWDVLQRNIECSKLSSISLTMLRQTNNNYVIRMMPLSSLFLVV